MGGCGLIPVLICIPSLGAISQCHTSSERVQREGGRTDVDFSFMLRAEKMLRPSCVPWELCEAERSRGTAAMLQFFIARVRAAAVLDMHQLLSTSDLRMSVMQLQCTNSWFMRLQPCNVICVDMHIPCYHLTLWSAACGHLIPEASLPFYGKTPLCVSVSVCVCAWANAHDRMIHCKLIKFVS